MVLLILLVYYWLHLKEWIYPVWPSLINICHIVPSIGDQEAVFIESSITLIPQQPKPRKDHTADTEFIKEIIDEIS